MINLPFSLCVLANVFRRLGVIYPMDCLCEMPICYSIFVCNSVVLGAYFSYQKYYLIWSSLEFDRPPMFILVIY
jgi:hypothetical protein